MNNITKGILLSISVASLVFLLSKPDTEDDDADGDTKNIVKPKQSTEKAKKAL